MIKRRDLNKMLQVNDFPDPTAHSPGRAETTTPLQMLFALNGSLLETQADHLAKRIAESATSPSDRIDLAYDFLFQRKPTPWEWDLGMKFVQSQEKEDAWPLYAQALLGSNEFLYVD